MENSILTSSSVATRTPLVLHSFPQEKLIHVITKLCVWCQNAKPPLLSCNNLDVKFYCVCSTQLSDSRLMHFLVSGKRILLSV